MVSKQEITVELIRDVDFMGHIRKKGERLVIDGHANGVAWVTMGHGSVTRLVLGLDAQPYSVVRVGHDEVSQ